MNSSMAGESAREHARRARQKSERLARYAESWEKGAEGELQTAAALSQLGPEWIRWHDLRWPGRRFANIDHVVIGPGGIFVVDSKSWSGVVAVRDNVLRQNGYRREAAVAGCADSALAVGELLPRYLDRVHPVLCFSRDDHIDGWARDVMVCSTTTLVPMLVSRKPVLNTAEVTDVVTTLQARMNSMPGPSSAVFAATTLQSTESGTVPSTRGTSSPSRAHHKPRSRLAKRVALGLGAWYLGCIAAFYGLRGVVVIRCGSRPRLCRPRSCRLVRRPKDLQVKGQRLSAQPRRNGVWRCLEFSPGEPWV